MPRQTAIRYATALAVVTMTACGSLLEVPMLRTGQLRFAPAMTSKIIATDGRLVSSIHSGEDRTVVPLDQIPTHTRDAVIAIEDRRFYEHEGVDVRAIVRAATENISAGDVRQGASTITQQLVRNTLMSAKERRKDTFERKLNEVALARQIEKRLTKDEILERYLNTVYFGSGAYGIQTAAQTMFHKPASALTLNESALLAGIIKSPLSYDPYKHPKRARQRRNVVLEMMVRLGHVDAARAERVTGRRLPTKKPDTDTPYPAAYFVDYVTRQLLYDERFAFLGDSVEERRRTLTTGGLRVKTTLDLDMQEAAEAAIDSILTEPNDPHGALVAIDPRNGHVKAMVGGRNYFARRKADHFAKLNLAIAGEPGLGRAYGPGREGSAPGTGRQAGSAFKPFALVTALQEGVSLSKGYTAASCMEFPEVNAGEPWQVCNYEQSAFGYLSLLEATVRSVNVVYAQLILEIGAPDVVRTARRMGINTPLSGVPSAALGTNPVNALGMASAYGTLATNGKHHPPLAIKKIVAADGDVLYEDATKTVRAVDSGAAYLATTALQQVMLRGTGTGAQIGRPAAGKTGTAQEYRDAWFVGYTPQLVASVWVGYPEASVEMKTYCIDPDPNVCRPTRIQVSGGTWPASIWKAFMLPALEGKPALDFELPEGASIAVTIDTRTGCLANDYTPEIYKEKRLFALGTQPSYTCSYSPPSYETQDEEEQEKEKEEEKPIDAPGRGPPPGRGHGNDD